ncbi:MAG: hypothetical protein A2X56_06305 [Nitrospirae bacterium GWC2_57_13]|jgi:hypothetical protein|nr:MAG: hypothetical protein A2X56_06305 [Nitrospirae bacterium GWC2_57_13]
MVLEDIDKMIEGMMGPIREDAAKDTCPICPARALPFTNRELDERLPVWRAISRLWLAQVLVERDLQDLAWILARSRFDWQELERICVYEVAPVVHENLRREEGIWRVFDAVWLISAIEQNMQQACYQQDALRQREYMMELVARDWDRVKQYVRGIRSTGRLSLEEQRGIVGLLRSADL